jgi:uncharacterized protein (DUF433 family)
VLFQFFIAEGKAMVANPRLLPAARYVTSDPQVLQGEPIVFGTEVAVRDVVGLWRSGVKPEEIPERLFDLVSVAQVFDALSFYSDSPEEVDRWIQKYQGHPTPLARLNPLWSDFEEGVAKHRQQVDTEA